MWDTQKIFSWSIPSSLWDHLEYGDQPVQRLRHYLSLVRSSKSIYLFLNKQWNLVWVFKPVRLYRGLLATNLGRTPYCISKWLQILLSTVTLQPIKAPGRPWLPLILFPFYVNSASFTISTWITTTVQPYAVISSHPVTSTSNVFITAHGFWHSQTHTFQLFSSEHP